MAKNLSPETLQNPMCFRVVLALLGGSIFYGGLCLRGKHTHYARLLGLAAPVVLKREAVCAFLNLIRNGKQSINPKNMDAGSTNLSGTNLNSRRLALSIAKGEPQGWGEYSRRRTHFIQDNKKPTKLVGCAGFLGPCEAFFGGAAGIEPASASPLPLALHAYPSL